MEAYKMPKTKKAEEKKAKTEGKPKTSKSKKQEIRALQVRSDGSSIKVDAEKIIHVKVIPRRRPEGLEVADYIFENGEIRFPVTLPFKELIEVKYVPRR